MKDKYDCPFLAFCNGRYFLIALMLKQNFVSLFYFFSQFCFDLIFLFYRVVIISIKKDAIMIVYFRLSHLRMKLDFVL